METLYWHEPQSIMGKNPSLEVPKGLWEIPLLQDLENSNIIVE